MDEGQGDWFNRCGRCLFILLHGLQVAEGVKVCRNDLADLDKEFCWAESEIRGNRIGDPFRLRDYQPPHRG
jgi:hypothetical protein